MAKNHSTVQLGQGIQDKCSGWGRAFRPSGSCSMGAILTGVGQCHSMNICAATTATLRVQAAEGQALLIVLKCSATQKMKRALPRGKLYSKDDATTPQPAAAGAPWIQLLHRKIGTTTAINACIGSW